MQRFSNEFYQKCQWIPVAYQTSATSEMKGTLRWVVTSKPGVCVVTLSLWPTGWQEAVLSVLKCDHCDQSSRTMWPFFAIKTCRWSRWNLCGSLVVRRRRTTPRAWNVSDRRGPTCRRPHRASNPSKRIPCCDHSWGGNSWDLSSTWVISPHWLGW